MNGGIDSIREGVRKPECEQGRAEDTLESSFAWRRPGLLPKSSRSQDDAQAERSTQDKTSESARDEICSCHDRFFRGVAQLLNRRKMFANDLQHLIAAVFYQVVMEGISTFVHLIQICTVVDQPQD